MPSYVVDKIADLLNSRKKCINGASVLLMGVSYKKNVGDLRESPAFDVAAELNLKKARTVYCDPYVPAFAGIKRVSHKNIDYKEYDCVVILADHDIIDYARLFRETQAVYDTRGLAAGKNKKNTRRL